MRFPRAIFLLITLLPGCGGTAPPVEKPPFRHYVAAVLTEPSQRALIDRLKKETPVPPDWTFVAHHMTIAPPSDNAYRIFTRDYPVAPGGKVKLRAIAFARDVKGLAAAVTSDPDYAALRGVNKNPHVTVAVAPGSTAFYSNQLLAEQKHTPLDPPIALTAHVCLVSDDSKRCVPDLDGLAADLRQFQVFSRPRTHRRPTCAFILSWLPGCASSPAR